MTEGEGFAWTTRDGVGVNIQLYTKILTPRQPDTPLHTIDKKHSLEEMVMYLRRG
jgi:hypothetical protein